jgi:hypothetical protein
MKTCLVLAGSVKVIRYAKRADGSLEATVSDGGQRAETFVFRRTP